MSTQNEDVSTPDEDVSTPDEDVSTPDEDVSTPDEDVSTLDEDVPTQDEDASTQDEDVSTQDEDAACVPACGGKECGDDGCGGSCGTCPGVAPYCVDFACAVAPACEPDCAGKECGDDGCGGDCGECPGVAPYCVDFVCALAPCEPDCGGKSCGDDGCGGSCGGCAPGESCNVAGQCQYGSQANGSFCGITAECTETMPNPQNPAEEIGNPAYPGCLSDQCDSDFCIQNFVGGEFALLEACSVHCTIVVDEINNASGLPGADGVQDPGSPFTDCTSFVDDGPFGAAHWECVSFGAPGSPATAICVPGTTFEECSSNDDCPPSETCEITMLGTGGLTVTQRCFAEKVAGTWGGVSDVGGACNDDPFVGDRLLCNGGLCSTVSGCLTFCSDDENCDTAGEGVCDSGECSNWPGKECTEDFECSWFECGAPFQLFSDLPGYLTQMCNPIGCDDVSECPDGSYCRFFWNGEEDAELAGWAHACLGETEGGAELGDECDPDPDDNIPGATCKAADLCIGGRCSAICADDGHCDQDAPANQACIVEEVPFDPDDDGFYNYILPLKYCQAFEHTGEIVDCFSELTCAAGESCTPYEVENWIEDPENAGEMILDPDAPYVLEGACTQNDPDQVYGTWGDPCGVAGTNPCESFCLGADASIGLPGVCTNLCESHADCPPFSSGDEEVQGRCTSRFRAAWGGDFDSITNDLWYSLCDVSSASSQEDCSNDGVCALESETCVGYTINFGPDYPAKTEYICDTIDEAGTVPTKSLGDECVPEAVDVFGDPTVDCKGLYCLGEPVPAFAAAQKFYCSRACNPAAEEPCEGGSPDMGCFERIVQPKAGAYADNAAGIFMCMKDQDCAPCGLSEECPGDRVCANLGTDDESNAYFACVPSCSPDSGACGASTCNQGSDALGTEVWGCFELDGGNPVNFCLEAQPCGDGTCSASETCSSCPSDCGECPAGGACLNADDLATIETQDVQGVATTAGTECLFAGDPAACATEKIVDQTGLSEPCADCYSGVFVCSISNCLAQCVPPNEASLACQECVAESCASVFTECSGLE